MEIRKLYKVVLSNMGVSETAGRIRVYEYNIIAETPKTYKYLTASDEVKMIKKSKVGGIQEGAMHRHCSIHEYTFDKDMIKEIRKDLYDEMLRIQKARMEAETAAYKRLEDGRGESIIWVDAWKGETIWDKLQ